MRYVFVALIVLLFATFSEARTTETYGLLNIAKDSDIIAVGTVELMNSYWADTVRNGIILTDVTVRINELIKGQPTLGANHVKFAIHGGTAYIPERQRVETHELVQEVKFEVGEQVMLFLRNANGEPYYANYPHGRHRVHMLTFGKRPIIDNKVTFLYGTEGDAGKTELPLELAKALGKAYQEDKNATIALENEIKALSVLDDDKVRELTNSAKHIAGGE